MGKQINKKAIIGVCILVVIVLAAAFLLLMSFNKNGTDINKDEQMGKYNIEGELYTLLKIDETEEENTYLNKENELVKINKDGNSISEFKFGKAIMHSNKYGVSGNKVIDYTGKTVIDENKYDEIKDLTVRYCVYKNDKCALADLNGNLLTDFIYDDIPNYMGIEEESKCYIVKKDGKYGVIDISGKELFECKYEMSDIEIYACSERR